MRPAGSGSCSTVVSMELWWIGEDGSVQDAFWYESAQWQRFELAPAGSESPNSGISAVSRIPNSMELWWIGGYGSIEDALVRVMPCGPGESFLAPVRCGLVPIAVQDKPSDWPTHRLAAQTPARSADRAASRGGPPAEMKDAAGSRDHNLMRSCRRSGTLIAMATVTRTFLVDDLDGSTEDVENVRLSLDGTNFEIDLSAANAARLRENLSRYVDHGTRVTPQKTRRSRRGAKPVASGRDQVQAVRDWARRNGYTVSARGRISRSILDALDAAH